MQQSPATTEQEALVRFVAQRLMESATTASQAEKAGVPAQMFAQVPQLRGLIHNMIWIGVVGSRDVVKRAEIESYARETIRLVALQRPDKAIDEAKLTAKVTDLMQFFDICVEFYNIEVKPRGDETPPPAANDSKIVLP